MKAPTWWPEDFWYCDVCQVAWLPDESTHCWSCATKGKRGHVHFPERICTEIHEDLNNGKT